MQPRMFVCLHLHLWKSVSHSTSVRAIQCCPMPWRMKAKPHCTAVWPLASLGASEAIKSSLHPNVAPLNKPDLPPADQHPMQLDVLFSHHLMAAEHILAPRHMQATELDH